LVARGLHDAFVAKITERIKGLRVGYQLMPGTQMGPLASAKQLEGVQRYVEIGKAEGAQLQCGGKRSRGRAVRLAAATSSRPSSAT
jgi:acyl-CoA reductase-like NAD-dependent aldehyde dehydrogenase